MTDTILITGATDGIGLATAERLAQAGRRLILHGRSTAKLDQTGAALRDRFPAADIQTVRGDFADLTEVAAMAETLRGKVTRLDVLINNAGVYRAPITETRHGLDLRFVVNTLAPYLLTQQLRSLFTTTTRIVNLSSAAQASVDLAALCGHIKLSDGSAYAQSKLALTMWSCAPPTEPRTPMMVAVNPGSMLGSKMVQDNFGVAGGDIAIGADILCRAALSDEFADAAGRYYDNDRRAFGPPHADARDPAKCRALVATLDQILAEQNLN